MHFHRTLVCWINFERPDYNISIRVFRSRDYTFRWPRYLFIPFLPCVEGGKYTNMRTILCICWVWKERRIKEKVKINKCDHCFVLNSISCLSIFNKNNKKNELMNCSVGKHRQDMTSGRLSSSKPQMKWTLLWNCIQSKNHYRPSNSSKFYG